MISIAPRIEVDRLPEPHVVWNHIDGPLLYLSNCQLHWLTWRERLSLWLGLTNIERINDDYVSRRKIDW